MADATHLDRYGNSVSIDELIKNRSPSEQTAIRYFQSVPEKKGCFSKTFTTDAEYLEIVNEQVGSLEDRKARALSKLGLDEEQVNEIPPVCFQGFTFLEDDVKGIKHDWVRLTSNDRLVLPTKELTWLFFGNDQVYVYKVRVDTCDNSLKSERTQEYFYRDVTAFASSSDSVRTKVPVIKTGCGSQTVEYVDRSIEKESFRIVVPGEIFECPVSPEDDNESKISAMKQKLREKKTT
jgi:hypothetical protein